MKIDSLFMNRIFVTYTFFLTVLLFMGVEGFARQSDIIHGVVLDDETGHSLPGATVQDLSGLGGVVTDAEGFFQLSVTAERKLELQFRSLGYRPVRLVVSLPLEQPLTIRMVPALQESEEVIVTGSPLGRSIHYQPASALNMERLQQLAAPSLGEILDGQPGVATRSFGSAPARPVIRGFDGDRVLVMQNGERMGDLSGTAVDHAVALDPLSMDRIEVIRGPASLLYGSSAIGGVVNMFSNDMPREWERGTTGSLATHVATVNRMGAGMVRAQHGTDRVAVTGRMIYRNAGDLQTPEGRLPDTSIQNSSFGSGVAWRSGDFETGFALSGMDYTYGLPEAIDDPSESIEIRMNRINLQSISTLRMNHFFDHAELRIHYSDYRHDEIEIGIRENGFISEDLEIAFDQQTISSSMVMRHRQTVLRKGLSA